MSRVVAFIKLPLSNIPCHFGCFSCTKRLFFGKRIRQGSHQGRTMGTDEFESDCWFGYARRSGEILFYYNIKTGEHRWPDDPSQSENTILRVKTSDVPPKPNEVCSVATQTEDYGCVNQCTSMYVDTERQNIENIERENSEKSQETCTVIVTDGDQCTSIMTNVAVEVNYDDPVQAIHTDSSSEHPEHYEVQALHQENEDIEESLSGESDDAKDSDYHVEDDQSDDGEAKVEDDQSGGGKKSKKTKMTKMKEKRVKKKCEPQKCSFCDKVFSRKSTLDCHIRVHTGEKPFKCTHCSKAFVRKSVLQDHLRGHTGDRPHKCTYCDKAFLHRNDLNDHLRIHTGEKPYKCSHCDKAFTQQGALIVHLRTHTGEKPFKCTFCERAFARKSHLDRHVKSHTGDRPFECTHCIRAFYQKSDLDRHFRTHTGEKPFECSICGKTFAYKTGFDIHVRTHKQTDETQVV